MAGHSVDERREEHRYFMGLRAFQASLRFCVV
jgi:hypothetical protein